MKQIKFTSILTLASIITLSMTSTAIGSSKVDPMQSYGNATVSSVHRLDEYVRIYCDIADLPPIIGQNIPVCIKGLKPSANPQDNLKLLMFLNELFLSPKSSLEKVLLKDIQRGEQFCLIANIEVDGKDLCDLLVEKKLAQKVIEVPQPKIPVSSSQPQDQASNAASITTETQYIAAKSSKVYHLPTCPHAQRIDAAKAVTFATREEAEKTGRRPCKTCKP